MSLLIFFKGNYAVAPIAPQVSTQAPGNHSFLYFPTTTNVPIDSSALLDVYFGSMAEIQYDMEEMRRRTLTIVMNQGEDVWLLPRLTKGTRCAFWKSEEEQCEKPLDPRSICYNTGWVGGYHNPMLIKVVIPPSDRVVTAYEEGNRLEYPVRPWTIHVPRLQERMLLVAKYSGVRYQITNVMETRWRGLVMSQEFEMSELSRGGSSSYAYSVPVPPPLPN